MSDQLPQRLALLNRSEHRALLRGINRGIEKESLRIDSQGRLAQTPHPAAFGSALTHPQITTDFSEALLEFITGVDTSIEHSLAELDAIHRFVYSELGDELLWPASMPCLLGPDSEIPVARYGSANIAQMKTRYRVGLSHRYGARMQTIAGIHYNFSLPEALWPLLQEADGDSADDYRTRAYFGLIRNFRRYSWLLVYLFGAAPAICKSFLGERAHQLQPLTRGTLHLPHGTSLRMGDLGYQSDAQSHLNICYNSLDNYIQTLRRAIITPHPDYEGFGADQQLSPGLLQIENEFYSPIRPKRVTKRGEIPLGALRRSGVEYIEVRCIDLNPEHPLGIDAEQIRFLDAFLLFCLLDHSPLCNESVYREITDNLRQVVDRGREPGLSLSDRGQTVALTAWAEQLLAGITDVAELLDAASGDGAYRTVVQAMAARVADPELTPSAQMLRELRERDMAYFELVMERAHSHAEHFRAQPLSEQQRAAFTAASESSRLRQRELEAADNMSFEDYLHQFYRQYDAL